MKQSQGKDGASCVKLVIIGDDLTGALDTGVQFAKQNIPTLVTSDMDITFEEIKGDFQVLAVNTDSRHDDTGTAYKKVAKVTRKALLRGVEYIYKKTDSALRGNIGAELSAALHESKARQLSFLPAYPNVNRVTKGGRQYIEGVPVQESAFAKDPFSPIQTSVIEDTIHIQSDAPVKQIPLGGSSGDFSGICVYDSISNSDLEAAGIGLKKRGLLRITAGCAGFAAFLPKLLDLKTTQYMPKPAGSPVLFVSGSLNEITVKQIEYARNIKVPVFTIGEDVFACGEPEEMDTGALLAFVKEAVADKRSAVIETAGDIYKLKTALQKMQAGDVAFEQRRSNIKKNIGHLVKKALEEIKIDTLAVFGGDTLTGVMDALECKCIMPAAEIADGIVCGKTETGLNIISKSGGFGAEDAIETIIKYLNNNL